MGGRSPRDTSGMGELRRRLVCCGIPPAVVERLAGELEDHLADLADTFQAQGLDKDDARAAAAQRLGDPQHLTEVLMDEFRGRTFFGRHPIVTFLLTPLPLLILIHVALYAAGIAAGQFVAGCLGRSSFGAFWFIHAMYWASLIVPYVVATGLYYRIASRSGRGWPWLAAACAEMGLWAACFHADLSYSIEPGLSRFTVGLGIGPGVMHVVNMLVPLAFGAWWLVRAHQRPSALPT